MKINENIWAGNNKVSDIVYSDSIYNLITNKKISLNTQYDLSICPWGLSKKDTTGYYLFFDGKPQQVGLATNDKITFSYSTSTSTKYSGDSIFFRTIGYSETNDFTNCVYSWSPNQRQTNKDGYIYPYDYNVIKSFVYNKLHGQCYVSCASNDFSNVKTDILLRNYETTYRESYPVITSLYFIVTYDNLTINICPIGNCSFDGNKLMNGMGHTNAGTIVQKMGLNVSASFPILGQYSPARNTPINNPVNMIYNTNKSKFADNIRLIKHPELVTKWKYSVSDPEAFSHKVYIGYELTYNQIVELCNSYGIIWFETNTYNAQSQYTHVPNFKGGKPDGTSTTGTDNISNPTYNWKNPWEDAGYNPNDNNNYTDKINLNKPSLTTTGIFNRTFALTANSIKSLANYLWNADETIFNEIVKGLSLMGGNPIDGLIDLRLYPFDVSAKTGGGDSKSIVVGRTDTKINGIEINDYNAILDLGSCTFFPNFGNFLDYEPFTTASLYIPYVGIVPISTADFMGQTISCKMVVDITTGSCTAIVFANDIPIIYKNGNIGVEIPMTGTNSAEYASRIAGGLTSGATDIALGAASKSVGQVVSGVGSIVDSALSVNNTMYNTAGSSSPACGLWQPQNCYFIIQRPVPIVPENYGHTVGYACNYQATISECSGYTQTYNVDVSSINAPESEKNAIAEILNSGFYA